MNDLTSPLSHKECQEFLAAYFEGIMEEGLLQPLEDFAKTNSSRIGNTARSWYDLQVAGDTPQSALSKVKPTLPGSITKLLAIGFEKSVLDLVLKDILYIYRDNNHRESVEADFEKLIAKYSKMNTDVICADCWNDELAKILFRSKIEGAHKVFLQQEGEDFLHQKYIGPKLVHIIEASISAVFRTLEKTLSDSSSSSGGLKLEDRIYLIEKTGPTEYVIRGEGEELNISFGAF